MSAGDKRSLIDMLYNFKNLNADSDIFAKDFIKVDTSSGVVNLKLPASPNDNDQIIIWDIKGTFNSNNCVINGNGNKVMGNDTIDLDIDNKEYHLIYDKNSSEWRIS